MLYKPKGYPDLSPYLLVADIEATCAFAEAAFGAMRLRMIPHKDGSVMHGELRIGDSVVMMGGMAGQPGSHIHLYLADPDAAMTRALESGGTVVQEMMEKGDGDRRGGVCDPCGTTWWISKQISEETS